jgi:hypothetical protein
MKAFTAVLAAATTVQAKRASYADNMLLALN